MKRAFFLALLLVNLGLLAWVRWYGDAPKSAPLPTPLPEAKPLELMSELSPAEKKSLAQATAAANLQGAAPAPSTAAAFGSMVIAPGQATASISVPAASTAAPMTSSVPGATLACASYGPFPSADAANSALTRLKLLGISGSQHLVPGKAKLGYWVYLPPFGSRKEAEAATDLLKKRGVTDIYVVADEANRNAISLGVFSQKDGAIQRQKEIKKLGYRPQMAERFRDEARYWLDAKGASGALPEAEAFKDLGDEGAPVGKASTACAG